MSRNVILIAAIVVIAGYFYFKSNDKSQEIISSQTNQEQAATETTSDSAQTEDSSLVENLIKEGIIERIDFDGKTPKVYVTADFYRIPDIDKTAIKKVLLKDFTAKYPEVTSFTIFDAKSGDEVETYGSH